MCKKRMRVHYIILAIILLSISVSAFVEPQVEHALHENQSTDVIVLLKSQDPEQKSFGISQISQQNTVLQKLGITEKKKTTDQFTLDSQFSHFNGFSGTLTQNGLETLRNNPNVLGIYEDRIYHISPDEEPQPEIALSTSVGTIGATTARTQLNLTGRNITVAVIDTGIDYRHDDLGNCTEVGGGCRIKGGHDFVNNDNDPLDDHGHGTHVAGIIGANGTLTGVAPQVELLAYKACNAAGSCSTSNIIKSVDAAIGNNSQIISISIGGEAQPNNGQSVLSLALNNAVAQGLVVVVSAGNNGPSTGCVSSPADALDVISVANANDNGNRDTSDDSISSSSCPGPSAFGRLDPDLSAPGTSITSTWLNEGTATISGTSMAAPHVSGSAALLLEYNASLTPAQIRQKLMSSATDISEHTFLQGAGMINVTRAVITNFSATYDNNDRLELLVEKGSVSEQTIEIRNSYDQDINVSATASSLSDLEGDNSIAASVFSCNPVVVQAQSTQNMTCTLTVPTLANASVYGGAIQLSSNISDHLRLPVALSVLQSSSDQFSLTVDSKRSTCSNTPCGDKIWIPIQSSSVPFLLTLNWSNQNNDLDLYLYNSSGNALATSGQGVSTSENISLNTSNTPLWTMIHSYDLVNNNQDLSFNYTISFEGEISTIITTPANNSFHNSAFTLDVSVSSTNLSLSNYSITNSSGQIVQQNQNNSINLATFSWQDLINISNTTFQDGNYTLTVTSQDRVGTIANVTHTFVVDKTAPRIVGIDTNQAVLYNDENLTLFVNITDMYLNTSTLFIESNFSGTLANHSLSNIVGNRYNYTIDSGNISNGENITYRFYATDLVGNRNVSDLFWLQVTNRNTTNLTIISPNDASVLELGVVSIFNVSAVDSDNDPLAYTWDFNDSSSATGSNVSKSYNQTGNYTVTATVNDTFGFVNSTNITVIVNDTRAPNVTLVYLAEHHVERDGTNYSLNASVLDYSGIFNATVIFNSSVQNRTCALQTSTQWECNWVWRTPQVGSYNFTINSTDNTSAKHTNSSTYSFSVVSCSDGVKNGNEGGVDCGGSCSNACNNVGSGSSSSSGSSGGGGGGGGGGGAAVSKSSQNENQEEKSSTPEQEEILVPEEQDENARATQRANAAEQEEQEIVSDERSLAGSAILDKFNVRSSSTILIIIFSLAGLVGLSTWFIHRKFSQ